ncbi:MAG TPA: S41 family peptidase [Chitinophagaceae bacterium]|nr:S41 family peptidase [Chitinophagaceae bacterium]
MLRAIYTTTKMMTRQILILIFLQTVVRVSFAQNCNCETKFSFLKTYIEKNYSGFQGKVRKDNKAEYNVFSQNILGPVQKTTNSIRCTELMNEWLAFFKDGHIQIWDKAKSKDTIPIRDLIERTDPAVQSKKISDKTFYIQILTFNGWNVKAIDSVFKTSENILKSTPNLILDLRENGGGSDFAYRSISPYLYTNPVYNIGEDVLSTDDNIISWRSLLNEDDIPQSFKEEIKTIVTEMKAHPGQFIPFGNDDIIKPDKVEPFPKKVVVLIDNRCASTTEQFLLEALQSKKVTLMGQHTKGVLDYANMRNVVFPCSSLMLAYATTRSRRINIGQGIDNIGIEPNITLPVGGDWIKEATKYLEQ